MKNVLTTAMLVAVFAFSTKAQWVDGGNTLSANGSLGTNSNHSLIFKTNNNEQGRITNGGNWGIGTSSPMGKFHVNGIGTFGNMATLSNATRALNLVDESAVMRVLRVHPTFAPAVELMSRTTADGANVAYWDFYAEPTDKSFRIRDRVGGGAGLDRMTIASPSGFVGVNTNTPLTRFHVNGTGAFGNQVTAASASRALNLVDNSAVMRILRTHATFAPAVELISRTTADGANAAYWDFYAEPSDASFRIRDRKDGGAGVDRVTISNPNGFVGIGTSVPEFLLDVNSRMRLRSSPGNTAGLWLNNVDNSALAGFVGVDNSNNMGFYGGASGWSLVMNTINGNVGIGTAAPQFPLDVRGGFCFGQYKATAGYAGIIIDKSAETQNGYIIHRTAGTDRWVEGTMGNNNFRIHNWATGNTALIINSANNNVGIGTLNPTYKLSVNGTIQAKEVRVESGWADYVFEPDYKLRPLTDVQTFITEHKHLPGIPSAKEIQAQGLAVGEVQTKMMEKIEELTLYILDLQKQIDQLKKESRKSH